MNHFLLIKGNAGTAPTPLRAPGWEKRG